MHICMQEEHKKTALIGRLVAAFLVSFSDPVVAVLDLSGQGAEVFTVTNGSELLQVVGKSGKRVTEEHTLLEDFLTDELSLRHGGYLLPTRDQSISSDGIPTVS